MKIDRRCGAILRIILACGVLTGAINAQELNQNTTQAPPQGMGRVSGKVIEAERGTPLAGVNISIDGTTLRTTTAIDGRYVILNVPEGTIGIRAATIGYAPKLVTGVIIKSGDATAQDIALSPMAVQVGEITVTAQVENGTVRAALDEQRASVGIVNAISSEQMTRSPDGDASAVAQRLSGATVEGGRTLNMRGMGDRMTQASLDGVRIPSPEPERRTVPIDLFPTALIESISARKTSAPDLPGDFSGGLVDIRMKDFTGRGQLSISVNSGFNSAVTGSTMNFSPSTSKDWLALGSNARALPSVIAATDFGHVMNGAETNALVSAFRRTWSVRPVSGGPNRGFGASLAGSLPLTNAGVGYLVSGNYSYTQETRQDEERAQALASGSTGGSVTAKDRFVGTTGRTSVLWGGIANLSTTMGSAGKVTLHNMYNRTMDNEGRSESGISEKLGYPLEIQRLRYVERSIYSSQLALEQSLSTRSDLKASVTLSGVQRQEPDRSEIVYELSNGQPSWLGFSNEAAVRTFGDLREHSLQADASWRLNLGTPSAPSSLRVGGSFRTTDRDATNRAFSITLLRPLGAADQYLTPEQIFDGRFTADESAPTFAVSPTSAGGSYTAKDRLAAGFAMLSTQVTPTLELIGGVRVEHSAVEVSSLSSAYEPSLANPVYTDVLPSLAANFRMSDRVNLRFSVSQTLSRPEYRELSPITYREVLGQDNIRGNAALQRALIQNYDVRWEFYPSRSEVLSAAVFVKEFSNPIERVYQGTSDQHVVTFVNAKGAHNYGLELEARKELGFISSGLSTFSAFSNLTLMHSRISIDPNSSSLTNPDRAMVSQAPYVVNAGLTWSHPSKDASATLLFNRVGDRIADAGEKPLPDVIEVARSVVDASVLLPVTGNLRLRMDGKNLLDAAYRHTQGGVVREAYRAGRIFSVGFSWKQ